MSEENEKQNYSAGNIQVLEGLEAVRKRPAMYIGDVGRKGLHHLIWEVVDNSIDEALAGYCNEINVYINQDGSITVTDNGRGIPVGMHSKLQKSALEVVLTVLHAGGKFDKDTYKVSGGLHGVGVSCVNALSTHLKATIYRNGSIFEQEYEIGKPLYEVKEIGKTDQTGTTITFMPDESIFTTTKYDFDIVASRLRELAFLNAGLQLILTDYREKDDNNDYIKEEFYSEGGLREFVKYLNGTKETLISDPIHVQGEKNGVPIEVALNYNTSYTETVFP